MEKMKVEPAKVQDHRDLVDRVDAHFASASREELTAVACRLAEMIVNSTVHEGTDEETGMLAAMALVDQAFQEIDTETPIVSDDWQNPISKG